MKLKGKRAAEVPQCEDIISLTHFADEESDEDDEEEEDNEEAEERLSSHANHGDANEEVAPRSLTLVSCSEVESEIAAEVRANEWDAIQRPTGKVNLAKCELYQDEINQQFKNLLDDGNFGKHSAEFLLEQPPTTGGYDNVKTATTCFLGRYFGCNTFCFNKDNLILAGGYEAALDMCGYVLFSPKDVILCASPFTTRVLQSLEERCQVELRPAPFKNLYDMKIDLTCFQIAYDKAVSKRKTVRCIFIQNACRCTGSQFSHSDIVALCNWAYSMKLWIIIDESLDDNSHSKENNTRPFRASKFLSEASVEIRHRCICIWSPSEDLCLPGLQLSAIHVECPRILKSLRRLAIVQPCAPLVQAFALRLFKDFEKIDEILRLKYERLEKNYRFVLGCLDQIGIPYVKPQSGVSVFIDLRSCMLHSRDLTGERKLWRQLWRAGVYLNPGSLFGAAQAGWFQISVTLHHIAMIRGLKLLEEVFAKYSRKNKNSNQLETNLKDLNSTKKVESIISGQLKNIKKEDEETGEKNVRERRRETREFLKEEFPPILVLSNFPLPEKRIGSEDAINNTVYFYASSSDEFEKQKMPSPLKKANEEDNLISLETEEKQKDKDSDENENSDKEDRDNCSEKREFEEELIPIELKNKQLHEDELGDLRRLYGGITTTEEKLAENDANEIEDNAEMVNHTIEKVEERFSNWNNKDGIEKKSDIGNDNKDEDNKNKAEWEKERNDDFEKYFQETHEENNEAKNDTGIYSNESEEEYSRKFSSTNPFVNDELLQVVFRPFDIAKAAKTQEEINEGENDTENINNVKDEIIRKVFAIFPPTEKWDELEDPFGELEENNYMTIFSGDQQISFQNYENLTRLQRRLLLASRIRWANEQAARRNLYAIGRMSAISERSDASDSADAVVFDESDNSFSSSRHSRKNDELKIIEEGNQLDNNGKARIHDEINKLNELESISAESSDYHQISKDQKEPSNDEIDAKLNKTTQSGDGENEKEDSMRVEPFSDFEFIKKLVEDGDEKHDIEEFKEGDNTAKKNYKGVKKDEAFEFIHEHKSKTTENKDKQKNNSPITENFDELLAKVFYPFEHQKEVEKIYKNVNENENKKFETDNRYWIDLINRDPDAHDKEKNNNKIDRNKKSNSEKHDNEKANHSSEDLIHTIKKDVDVQKENDTDISEINRPVWSPTDSGIPADSNFSRSDDEDFPREGETEKIRRRTKEIDEFADQFGEHFLGDAKPLASSTLNRQIQKERKSKDLCEDHKDNTIPLFRNDFLDVANHLDDSGVFVENNHGSISVEFPILISEEKVNYENENATLIHCLFLDDENSTKNDSEPFKKNNRIVIESQNNVNPKRELINVLFKENLKKENLKTSVLNVNEERTVLTMPYEAIKELEKVDKKEYSNFNKKLSENHTSSNAAIPQNYEPLENFLKNSHNIQHRTSTIADNCKKNNQLKHENVNLSENKDDTRDNMDSKMMELKSNSKNVLEIIKFYNTSIRTRPTKTEVHLGNKESHENVELFFKNNSHKCSSFESECILPKKTEEAVRLWANTSPTVYAKKYEYEAMGIPVVYNKNPLIIVGHTESTYENQFAEKIINENSIRPIYSCVIPLTDEENFEELKKKTKSNKTNEWSRIQLNDNVDYYKQSHNDDWGNPIGNGTSAKRTQFQHYLLMTRNARPLIQSPSKLLADTLFRKGIGKKIIDWSSDEFVFEQTDIMEISYQINGNIANEFSTLDRNEGEIFTKSLIRICDTTPKKVLQQIYLKNQTSQSNKKCESNNKKCESEFESEFLNKNEVRIFAEKNEDVKTLIADKAEELVIEEMKGSVSSSRNFGVQTERTSTETLCAQLRIHKMKRKTKSIDHQEAKSTNNNNMHGIHEHEFVVCRNPRHTAQRDHCDPHRMYIIRESRMPRRKGTKMAHCNLWL